MENSRKKNSAHEWIIIFEERRHTELSLAFLWNQNTKQMKKKILFSKWFTMMAVNVPSYIRAHNFTFIYSSSLMKATIIWLNIKNSNRSFCRSILYGEFSFFVWFVHILVSLSLSLIFALEFSRHCSIELIKRYICDDWFCTWHISPNILKIAT